MRRGGGEDAALLSEYRRTGDPVARGRLIECHLPLVRSLARRYAHCGERVEDLEQVGSIALIEAIDRFDPQRGTDLAAFAVPTITGAIRNHLRDRTAVVRVPRREHARPAVPLAAADGEDGACDRALVVDGEFESSDDLLLLAVGFRTLDARERRILHLRFFAGLSQAEIAREVGLSQVQVSRVIRTSLERLRRALANGRARPPQKCLERH